MEGVFIRAPWVESAGAEVEVLARHGGHIVAVRQGHVLATSFHPELTGDHRVHQYSWTWCGNIAVTAPGRISGVRRGNR